MYHKTTLLYFGTQPIGTQPFGTPPIGTQPFGTPPFGTQPFGTPPIGTNKKGTTYMYLYIVPVLIEKWIRLSVTHLQLLHLSMDFESKHIYGLPMAQ